MIEGVSEMVGRFLFKQMLEAVQSCHFKGICHRSISLESFLLDSNFSIKLTQFSQAKSFRDDGVLSGQCGENHCQPPEMRAGILYLGKEVDIFQLGVCLFQMVTGVRPFENALPEDKYYKCIAANRQDIFFEKHLKDSRTKTAGISEEFKSLFVGMVQILPPHRISMSEVMSHPWMHSPMPVMEEVF